eukprot:5243796-Amphidinium_carterae.3
MKLNTGSGFKRDRDPNLPSQTLSAPSRAMMHNVTMCSRSSTASPQRTQRSPTPNSAWTRGSRMPHPSKGRIKRRL